MNRFPRGFLNWLDAKTRGDTPREFSELLQLGADISAFYDAGCGTQIRRALQVGGIGILANLTVPATEIWVVHTVGFEATASGVGALQFNGIFAPSADLSTFATVTPQYEGSLVGLAAGIGTSVVWVPPGRFIALPGFTWAIQCSRATVNQSFVTSAVVSVIALS